MKINTLLKVADDETRGVLKVVKSNLWKNGIDDDVCAIYDFRHFLSKQLNVNLDEIWKMNKVRAELVSNGYKLACKNDPDDQLICFSSKTVLLLKKIESKIGYLMFFMFTYTFLLFFL